MRRTPAAVSWYFNPRSLAGATLILPRLKKLPEISIHAPSRERLAKRIYGDEAALFQSTLPRGSDHTMSC